MPTSLPVRTLDIAPRTSPSALIAVVLVFTVLIVMTLHPPAFDQVEMGSTDSFAGSPAHGV